MCYSDIVYSYCSNLRRECFTWNLYLFTEATILVFLIALSEYLIIFKTSTFYNAYVIMIKLLLFHFYSIYKICEASSRFSFKAFLKIFIKFYFSPVKIIFIRLMCEIFVSSHMSFCRIGTLFNTLHFKDFNSTLLTTLLALLCSLRKFIFHKLNFNELLSMK